MNDALLAFIESHGYQLPLDLELDDEFHTVACLKTGVKLRYAGLKDSKGNIRLTFGTWADTGTTWTYKDGKVHVSKEERDAKKKALVDRQLELSIIAKAKFEEPWEGGPSGGTYLTRKWPFPTVPFCKLGWEKDINHEWMLKLPMSDVDGKIWNVQFIQKDGTKRMIAGAKGQGLFMEIGELSDGCTYICEGFSTALSVSEAMQSRALCAFGAGNIPHLLKEFKRRKIPGHFVVVLDNDWEKKINAGEVLREKINKQFQGVRVVLPSRELLSLGMSDYNDIHLSNSDKEIVRQDIIKQLKDYPMNDPTPPNQMEFPTNDAPSTDNLSSIKTKHDATGTYVGDIKSFDTGFHIETLKGDTIVRIPDYLGLQKYFARKTNYKILGESKICMHWMGTHYEPLPDIYIESFAQDHFFPTAKNHMISEFKNLVLRTNVRPIEFFTQKTQRKMNFKNGYYDIELKKLFASDPEIGFRYCLPYEYDSKATCPQFDRFLGRITSHDKKLEELLLEYCGYAISGDDCWAQKVLVITGEGANGKSTFVNVLREIFGERNTSAVSARSFGDPNSLILMDGKLMNMAEETPKKAFMDSDVFKNLVTGGVVSVKKLYKDQYEVRMQTKLMLLCNELPPTWDSTVGFFRRLIIAPFKATFHRGQAEYDPYIEKKLKGELAGIANRILGAYVALKTRGWFDIPEVAEQALEQYKLDNDHVVTWKDDSIEVHPLGNGHDNHWAAVGHLYKNYADYCRETGHRAMNNMTFGRQLRRIVPNYTERYGFFGPEKDRKRGLKGVTRMNGVEFGSSVQEKGDTGSKMTISRENQKMENSELF